MVRRNQDPLKQEREKQREHEREVRQSEQQTQVGNTILGNPNLLEESRDAKFLETLGEFDIGREEFDDDLDEELAAELSRLLQFGYIKREDWEHYREKNDLKANALKAEHPAMSGASSKCTGQVREIMLGANGESRPKLTPETARRYDSAMETRSFGMSNSIEGRGLDAVATIQAAIDAATGSDEEGSGKSVFSKARNMLPGGGSS